MESSTDNNGGDQNGDDPPKSRKKDAPGQDVATFEEYDDDEEEDSKATGSYNAGRKRKRERSGHQYRWEQMYNRLVEFRQRNGHCNVPNRYMEDPQLGSWVSAQRRAFKTITTGGTGSTAMTMERAQKLQQIGFHWRGTNPHNVPWEMRYKELLDFIKRFGHPNIPMRWKENVQLSNWVSKQRHDYKLLQRGTSNRLTPQRLKLLNDVGFVWEIERCAESTQQRLSVLGQRSEEDGSTTQQQSLDVKPPARNRGDPSGKVLSSGGGDGTLSGLSGTPVAAGATARMDANMMEMIAAAAASTARGPSATGTAVPSTCTAVAHLFNCPKHHKDRRIFLQKVSQDAVAMETDPLLLDMLIDGLESTFDNRNPHPSYALPPQHHRLFKAQSKIGWHNLLRGRLSLEWGELQDQFLQRNKLKEKKRNGAAWALSMVNSIWTNWFQFLWVPRNEIRHGHNKTTREAAKHQQAFREVSLLYEAYQGKVLSIDNFAFNTPLEEMQHNTHHQLRNWINAYHKLLQCSFEQAKQQDTNCVPISEYFHPRQIRPTTANAPLNHRH